MNKAFLIFCALFWMVYGFFCFFWPNTVAGFIGFEFVSADAIIEVVSMYGGLEFGLGCMFLYCALKPELVKTGLLLVMFTIGFLALTRVLGLLMHGGDVGVYTYGGIFYEGVSGLVALVLWLNYKEVESTA